MGNAASVEELGRGQRTSHKLSKPRTGNPAETSTNKLLSPIGRPNPRRRFSTSRTTSLPYGTSPAPDPSSQWAFADMSAAEATSASGDDQPELKSRSRSRSITRAANAIFRSRSSQTPHGSRRQTGSVGRQTPSQSALPSRTNSMIIGASESSYTQVNPSSWHPSDSRNSAAYGLNSYEAKRLLNLVEEPSGENHSIVSDSQFQVRELAIRDSIGLALADAPPAGTIARANSDLSMYTPMRRRSLLVTPGLATRRPEPPKVPRNASARFSLPSTPARRDSLESMGDMFSIPIPTLDLQSIPRASTPCDDDYGHIGAFKLGSLRITNGSPVASPLSDLEPSRSDNLGELAYRSHGVEYFERHLKVRNHARTSSLESAGGAVDIPRSTPNNAYLRPIQTMPQTFQQENVLPQLPTSSRYLPEVHLSPLVIEAPDANSTGLQTTSKHSALEDDLFQDEQEEILQPEVLDVRVDLHAKSLPPRPRLISEGRNPRAMMRSDSGVVATPISEEPHGSGALSKSDSGYSSNISLRSFSAKPPVPEKEEATAQPVDIPPRTPAKDSFPAELGMGLEAGDVVVHSVVSETSESRAPPLPRKDMTVDVEESTTKVVLPISTKVSEFFGERAFVIEQKTLREPARNGQDQSNSHFGSLELPPLSPTGSVPSATSSSNGSTGTRKPGKLERLISNARKPLTIHVTQPSEKESANSASRNDGEPKGDHGVTFSKSLKRLALKPVSSKATLGTIYSVGSAEGREEEPPLPSVPMVVSNALEINGGRPGGIAGPRPLPRKPLPIRKNSIDATVQRMPTLKSTRDEPLSPSSVKVASPTSMSVRLVEAEPQSPRLGDNKPSSPASEMDQQRKSRYSPPISMKTRTQAPVRVTPPSRSKSTPPVARQTSPAPALPRKASRENMHQYSPNKPSLSRRSSRESVHSYPPAQLHYESLDYHMAASMLGGNGLHYQTNVQARSTVYRQPDWSVQTDHGAPSGRSSLDQSRQNSLSNSSSHYNSGRHEFKPRFQSPKPSVRPSADAVRRLSSYGNPGRQQDQRAVQAAYDESNALPGSAIPMPPPSFDQQTQSSTHVPRGHSRTNSLGSSGSRNAPPYRVLHSYNSPAYRNAPIWG